MKIWKYILWTYMDQSDLKYVLVPGCWFIRGRNMKIWTFELWFLFIKNTRPWNKAESAEHDPCSSITSRIVHGTSKRLRVYVTMQWSFNAPQRYSILNWCYFSSIWYVMLSAALEHSMCTGAFGRAASIEFYWNALGKLHSKEHWFAWVLSLS